MTKVQILTEFDALRLYDDMWDESYPLVSIGNLTFQPSRIIKELDPIAYKVGFHDWCDSIMEDDILVEGVTYEEDQTEIVFTPEFDQDTNVVPFTRKD
jgi:hypothetical protein